MQYALAVAEQLKVPPRRYEFDTRFRDPVTLAEYLRAQPESLDHVASG